MKSWDSIARRYVEHDTTAQTTFGELPTANDEERESKPLLNPEEEASIVEDINSGRWAYLQPLNDNLPAANLRHALPDRILSGIRDLPGFVYLGSPYSLYRGGHAEAARVVASYAAAMMASGLRVYSPIAHGHFVNAHGTLPLSWDFWKDQCQPMVDSASSLVVLTMDGWRDSVGLTYEIEEFVRAGKLVLYVALVLAGRAAA